MLRKAAAAVDRDEGPAHPSAGASGGLEGGFGDSLVAGGPPAHWLALFGDTPPVLAEYGGHDPAAAEPAGPGPALSDKGAASASTDEAIATAAIRAVESASPSAMRPRYDTPVRPPAGDPGFASAAAPSALPDYPSTGSQVSRKTLRTAAVSLVTATPARIRARLSRSGSARRSSAPRASAAAPMQVSSSPVAIQARTQPETRRRRGLCVKVPEFVRQAFARVEQAAVAPTIPVDGAHITAPSSSDTTFAIPHMSVARQHPDPSTPNATTSRPVWPQAPAPIDMAPPPTVDLMTRQPLAAGLAGPAHHAEAAVTVTPSAIEAGAAPWPLLPDVTEPGRFADPLADATHRRRARREHLGA